MKSGSPKEDMRRTYGRLRGFQQRPDSLPHVARQDGFEILQRHTFPVFVAGVETTIGVLQRIAREDQRQKPEHVLRGDIGYTVISGVDEASALPRFLVGVELVKLGFRNR